jgi:hypothetical protein
MSAVDVRACANHIKERTPNQNVGGGRLVGGRGIKLAYMEDDSMLHHTLSTYWSKLYINRFNHLQTERS